MADDEHPFKPTGEIKTAVFERAKNGEQLPDKPAQPAAHDASDDEGPFLRTGEIKPSIIDKIHDAGDRPGPSADRPLAQDSPGTRPAQLPKARSRPRLVVDRLMLAVVLGLIVILGMLVMLVQAVTHAQVPGPQQPGFEMRSKASGDDAVRSVGPQPTSTLVPREGSAESVSDAIYSTIRIDAPESLQTQLASIVQQDSQPAGEQTFAVDVRQQPVAADNRRDAGCLSGQVVSRDKSPLPGALLEVHSDPAGRFQAATSAHGAYRFCGLDIVTWRVELVSVPGRPAFSIRPQASVHVEGNTDQEVVVTFSEL